MTTKRSNYKDLWRNLRLVISCSGKKRYTPREIFDLMSLIELTQVTPDLSEVMQLLPSKKEVKK